MTAPHFFVDSLDDDIVELMGEEAHHAVRALRIRAGERITLSDGVARTAGARVIAAEAGKRALLRAEVLDRRTVEQPRPRVVVFPAVPKSGKLELIVQKLTELGVDSIRPWFAARSIARWDEAKARAHGERLRSVAREAAKQSRRALLPEVLDPGPLGRLSLLTVVLHEEMERGLRSALPPEPPDQVAMIVGPEGGLDEAEIARFSSEGAVIAGLGPSVLRTETAAIVGATLLMSHYGRLG